MSSASNQIWKICLCQAWVVFFTGCSTNSNDLVELEVEPSGSELGSFPDELSEKGFNKPSPAPVSYFVPRGTILLSKNKPVGSSDYLPLIGELTMITDGVRQGGVGNTVSLSAGLQWVQIDLEVPSEIYAIALWRLAGSRPIVYRDVVILCSFEKSFQKFEVVYNNDYDNTHGFGYGKDSEFVEWSPPKLIELDGVSGQYVRIYSNGSYYSGANNYVEVEIFGVVSK